MAKIDNAEIRAFLEAQGYHVAKYIYAMPFDDWIYTTDGQDVTWEAFADEDEPNYHYEKALEHFLREELGRHWREMYEIWWQVETQLNEENGVAIETAIRYLETLGLKAEE